MGISLIRMGVSPSRKRRMLRGTLISLTKTWRVRCKISYSYRHNKETNIKVIEMYHLPGKSRQMPIRGVLKFNPARYVILRQEK
jgi:hypothetical protein